MIGVFAPCDGFHAEALDFCTFCAEVLGHVVADGGQLFEGVDVDVNDLKQSLDTTEEHCNSCEHGVTPDQGCGSRLILYYAERDDDERWGGCVLYCSYPGGGNLDCVLQLGRY